VSYPGACLRHQNYRLKQQALDGSDLFNQDASFWEVPGLANSDWKSYPSYNMPGHDIRHRNWEFWVETGSGSLFLNDATFCRAAPFVLDTLIASCGSGCAPGR
jgi:hypothetical protein